MTWEHNRHTELIKQSEFIPDDLLTKNKYTVTYHNNTSYGLDYWSPTKNSASAVMLLIYGRKLMTIATNIKEHISRSITLLRNLFILADHCINFWKTRYIALNNLITRFDTTPPPPKRFETPNLVLNTTIEEILIPVG